MTDPILPSSKQPCAREDALAVVKRLRDSGYVAYFAGGCVRDELLGIEPKDYDVATDAPPTRVRELFRNTQAVGAAFGVILVRHGQSVVEVATFRSDGAYLDGRRPTEVRFTTAEEDAKRRDFTINGMFYDPVENEVIDYVGGQDDLKHKRLRAIGDPDARFEEDHLRLLRAVRFAARFGLEIEGSTAAAIAKHAQQLKQISPERIADELRMMLTPPTRVGAWHNLWKFQLMQVIFRHLPEKPGVPHAERQIFPRVRRDQSISFGLTLSAMALCYRATSRPDLGELLEPQEVRRTVQACRTALKISNEEADWIVGCTGLGPLLRDQPPTIATMKRFLARPFARDARELMHGIGQAFPAKASRVQWLEEQFDRFFAGDYAPAPLLTGDDLTAAGWTPGPIFKRVLDQVYDAQLEDRIKSKDQALELADRTRASVSPEGRGSG